MSNPIDDTIDYLKIINKVFRVDPDNQIIGFKFMKRQTPTPRTQTNQDFLASLLGKTLIAEINSDDFLPQTIYAKIGSIVTNQLHIVLFLETELELTAVTDCNFVEKCVYYPDNGTVDIESKSLLDDEVLVAKDCKCRII